LTNEECLKIFNDETLPYLKLVFGSDADFHVEFKKKLFGTKAYLYKDNNTECECYGSINTFSTICVGYMEIFGNDHIDILNSTIDQVRELERKVFEDVMLKKPEYVFQEKGIVVDFKLVWEKSKHKYSYSSSKTAFEDFAYIYPIIKINGKEALIYETRKIGHKCLNDRLCHSFDISSMNYEGNGVDDVQICIRRAGNILRDMDSILVDEISRFIENESDYTVEYLD
jgi:hypothetical protein